MERFIREKELEKMLGVSRTTLWRRESAREIPKHRRFGGINVWLQSEIVAWMSGLGEEQ